ncbi:MAG TPA: divalent-cation tolerance protein CutA [Candidatus Acidoferrum sp.]|nr:divalent-cation tolerance protein CutA [Candidatus Acidoferrum sp.]
MTGGRYRIVLVTCGSMAEARRISSSVVEKRLAACANIVLGGVESIYRWKGKVERAREVLVVMKTITGRLGELESEVKRRHSYEVPEFVVLPVAAGSREYLAWLGESVDDVVGIKASTLTPGAATRRRVGPGRGRR